MGWQLQLDAAGMGICHLPDESIQLVDTEPADIWVICAGQEHHVQILDCQCTRLWKHHWHHRYPAVLYKKKQFCLCSYFFFLWLCRRKYADAAPIEGTSSRAKCLMISQASKVSPHSLNLLWFGEINDSVEDGHYFLYDIVDSHAKLLMACEKCRQLLCRTPHRQANIL